jgi:hypothetical protein
MLMPATSITGDLLRQRKQLTDITTARWYERYLDIADTNVEWIA